jgi:hypothetical protein
MGIVRVAEHLGLDAARREVHPSYLFRVDEQLQPARAARRLASWS